MKTLALQKIGERTQLSLSRIKYKAILMNEEKCKECKLHNCRGCKHLEKCFDEMMEV